MHTIQNLGKLKGIGIYALLLACCYEVILRGGVWFLTRQFSESYCDLHFLPCMITATLNCIFITYVVLVKAHIHNDPPVCLIL